MITQSSFLFKEDLKTIRNTSLRLFIPIIWHHLSLLLTDSQTWSFFSRWQQYLKTHSCVILEKLFYKQGENYYYVLSCVVPRNKNINFLNPFPSHQSKYTLQLKLTPILSTFSHIWNFQWLSLSFQHKKRTVFIRRTNVGSGFVQGLENG